METFVTERPRSTFSAGHRWKLPRPWAGIFRRREIPVLFAIVCVTLLLGTSAPQPGLTSSKKSTDSSPSIPTAPAASFTPYLINSSEYPVPDILLNNSSGVYDPQLTTSVYQNQTVYGLVYGQEAANGLSYSIQYLNGRYDPSAAVCILNRTGCSPNATHLPIYWGSPWMIYNLGSSSRLQGTAVGSSGSLVAAAFSTNNRTRLLYTYDFGQSKVWNDPTPTTIPGIEPKLSVSPTAIYLTTVTPTGGVYATVFHIPNVPPPTTFQSGGRRPLILTPVVTSVSPFYGTSGSTVDIYGANFGTPLTVKFGTHSAISTTLVNSNHVQAVVPAYPSSTPVNVTVGVSAVYSNPDPPYDWFTIATSQPTPQVLSVVPDYALPNSSVSIVGYGFASTGTYVQFGTSNALSVGYGNSTSLGAVVPWGRGGPTDVFVTSAGHASSPSSPDHFTYAVSQAILPRALDASPVQLSNGASGIPIFGTFATDANSSKSTFYNSTNGGAGYSSTSLAGFSASTGSSIFSQIGSTRLFLGGGLSGQVATVGFGQTIFGLFTANVGNRTVVETEGSSDGGLTWNGPYYSSPLLGSVESPYATIAPSGIVYVTWAENGAGPWQIDQAVYSESGRLLLGPQALPGSGGPVGKSAMNPSVAVDGLDRPLFVWGWTSDAACGLCIYARPSNVSLAATGGFLNASTSTSELTNAFKRTVPTDYIPRDFFWPSNATSNRNGFQTPVEADLGLIQADISASKPTCTLQNLALRYLLPNLSFQPAIAAFYGIPGHCSIVSASIATQIANLAGPDAANTFLGVYSDWLLEAVGYGALKEPYWAGAPEQSELMRNYQLHPPPLHLPPNTISNATSTSAHLTVAPLTLNPNSIFLNVTGWIRGAQAGGANWCNTTHTARLSDYWSYTPIYSNETVYVNQLIGGSYHGTFTPSGWMPSVYLTGLPSGFFGNYTVTVKVTYQETQTYFNGCGNPSGNFQNKVVNFTLGPKYQNLTLIGNLTTYLEGLPADLTVRDTGNSTAGNATLEVPWNNSILANYTERTVGTGVVRANSTNSFAISESIGKMIVPTNKGYNTTVNLTSVPGGYNASGWANRFNTGLSGNSSAETFNSTTPWTCSFRVPSANPVHIDSNSTAVAGITTTNATLTWWSNYAGDGWVTYNDSDDGAFTQTAQMLDDSTNWTHRPFPGDPYLYIVQLHGLSQWALYRVSVGVTTVGGTCLVYDNEVRWHFHTLSFFTLEEQDFPYDSITQQGGGAQFRWSIPTAFDSSATYRNGSMNYCQWWTNRTPAQCGPGTNVTVPLPTLNAELAGSNFALSQVNSSFILNTTGLTLNTQYNVSLELYFNYAGTTFNASSRPLVFWYEKDTSGDGLTDWEKVHGWEVTTQSASGSWNVPFWATANPNLYATNGLVNDFVEKEFALNPSTVDTAGSHMLDTWNLTFDLGPKTQPLRVPTGANFQFWYEDGNQSTDFNWNKSCQYFAPPGSGNCLVGAASSHVYSNITGADSGAWAARVMWSRSALTSFVNLSGVRNTSWLRAILGNSSNQWTLTVSGKLSWGANPLATSTPRDGIADGARVDPLYDENLVISSLSANIYNSASKGCPDPGTTSGNSFGWAPLFYLNYSTGGSSYNELPAGGNYTRQSNDTHFSGGGQCGSLSNWKVAIPISATTQNQTLQARLILHYTGGGKDQLWAEKFNTTSGTSYKAATVSFDTVRGSSPSNHCTIIAVCQFSGTNGTLNFTLSVIPAGVKDPTYLWLPNDNGTLSNLPWGLKRYSGEQGFDTLQIDQTSGGPISANIPYAQNVSRIYSLTLASGLSTLIVPRGQFLNSSLGRGILLNESLPWNTSNPAPPLLNHTANVTLSTFARSNPLSNLGCYWQNRAINTTTGPSGLCSNESGTYWKLSNENIAIVLTNASNGVNTGGVPGNPSLETPSEEGAAVQSILTLNVTSQTELVLLLAALVDNNDGGVNGTILPVTYQVPCLGLNPVLTDVLANVTFNSSGLFGKPESIWVPPPPPPCNGASCWTSNLVSGIVSVGGTFVSYVWTPAIALATFVDDHLPTWLKDLGAVIAARTTAFLSAAGTLLLIAIEAALSFILSAIRVALGAVITPIISAADSYDTKIGATSNQTLIDYSANGSVSVSDALSWAQSFDPLFILGIAVSITIGIVIGIMTPVDIGVGFLTGAIVSLLGTMALGATVPYLTGLSSSNILTFASSFTNSIPSVDWHALAGAIAIAAASTDFGFTMLMTVLKAGTFTPGVWEEVGASITIDMIVGVISTVSWISHLWEVAAAAAAFAAVGGIYAYTFLRYNKEPGVATYAAATFALSLIGGGAAGYDALTANY